MLVQSHERAERRGTEVFQQQRRRRLIPGKDAVRQQIDHLFRGQGFLRQALAHFAFRLAERQRGTLRKTVRQQRLLVSGKRVIRTHRSDEIARDQPSALVQQLEEGMLAVVAEFSPDDRRRRAIDRIAADAHRLSVAFHFELLQERREIFQRFVVRQHGIACRTEEIGIPDADQRHDHRQVLRQGSRAEMLVHAFRAPQQFVEGMRPYGNHQRQPDGRPQGIAPADPVPDREHAVAADTKLHRPLRTARYGGEVLRQIDIVAEIGFQPIARRLGIQHRLLGGERLADHDEQGGPRIERLQKRSQLRPVEIRHIVHTQRRVADGAQRLINHLRPQIGAADAYIHDVANRHALMPHALAGTQRFSKLAHPLPGTLHLWHHIALRIGERRCRAAQRDMQNSTIFGDVDVITGEHPSNPLGEERLFRQLDQQGKRFGRHALLGEIEKNVVEREAESFSTLRVAGEQFAEMNLLCFLAMSTKIRPCPRGRNCH